MRIGERIKLKRKEKGLSQRDLASLMGYSHHSTLARIENGLVDVSQKKIVQFAEVLGVSVAYLMGWDEAEKNAPGKDNLTEDEKEWLEMFQGIPDEARALTLDVFRMFRKIPEDRQAEALELLQVALRMQKKSE